jgi:L-iditol 2-dehydrogenase
MLNNGIALFGKEDLRHHQWELPVSESGSILLRVGMCGICGSDLRQYFAGPSPRYDLPAILGHEFVGEIVQIEGSSDEYSVGDLVSIAPVIPCMNCRACRRGQDNLCERGLVIGVNYPGAFAEYFYTPPRMVAAGGLQKIQPGTQLEALALNELLSCCWHGLGQIGFTAGDDVLIIGEGPIGAIFTRLLKYMGAGRITVTGLNPYRLEFTHQFGADVALDINREKLSDFAHQSGYHPDLAIVAAPVVDDALVALEILRKGGDLLLFSGYPYGTQLSFDLYQFHYSQKHIHGSIDATIQDFHQAIQLQPFLGLEKLITHQYPIDQADEAFHKAHDQEAMKVVLKP